MNNATIHAALLERIPALTEQTSRLIGWQFDSLVKSFGTTMAGVYNSKQGKVWRETIRGLCDCAQPVDKKPWEHDLGVYSLNAEKVERAAARIAADAAVAWEAKITAKLGELDAATVTADGVRFVIQGTRAGRRVQIQQDMIINISPKGTLFNQFPARIYVDDKFTSAAAYIKLFS